ncbi:MAG: hypothetical protein K2Y37_10520 [Pirellulales bacterium]|nr:hypothetical protein [Pirellulales bacterium]
MRADMAKVIVERPRVGSRSRQAAKGYQKRLQRWGLEEAPRREGMYARGGRTKSLNEHLGPLRRYLRKQVGRPWNLVFSEICQNIRLDSAVQSHVRDHVWDYVELQVIEIDGVPCYGAGWLHGRPIATWGRQFLYVCPRTGLLREIKPQARMRQAVEVTHVRIDAERVWWRMGEIWFEVVFRSLSMATPRDWDHVLRVPAREVTTSLAMCTYGALVYAAAKRQLNSREARKARALLQQAP